MNELNVEQPLANSMPWFLRTGPRLFATLFLVIAIPILTTIYLEITQISHKFKKQAIYQNNLATQLVAHAIEEHYLGIANYMESFATRSSLIGALKKNDSREITYQLKDLLRENRFLDRVFITDANGALIFNYPPDATISETDFSSNEWFQEAWKTQKTFVLQFHSSLNNPKLSLITVAVPIKDVNARTFAYLVNQETSESFMLWFQKINPSFGGFIALVDRNGNLVASNELAPTNLVNLSSDPFLRKAFMTHRGQVQGIEPIQKKESLITYTIIEPIQWLVFSSQPVATVLAPLSTLKPTLFGLGLACFSAIFFLGLIWLNSIHRYSHALMRHHHIREQNLIELKQAIQERKLAEEALRLSNQELQVKVQELEQLNRIMIGREKRILELKEKLKTMHTKFNDHSS